ncbi:MAG: TolC family protein [Spirochaetaceae bacterium]|jgi:outer membrane protein TolC|nr:TolC family protein [Spirochaetaceae bacterium]
MKKRITISVMIVFITAFNAAALEYDLSAYLHAVEQNNTDIALAYRELLLSREQVKQARSPLLPGIGAEGNYTRNLQDMPRSTAVASRPGGGPLIYQDVDTNYDNELSIGVGLTQKLFDPAAWAQYRQAKKGLSIREQAFEATRQNIRSAAKKRYAQTQLALSVLTIREASEEASRTLYQSAERKYHAGAATELDLLMAEVDWKQKALSVDEARRNAETALLAFRQFASIPLSEEIVLTENSGQIPPLPEPRALDSVLAGRADYRALLLSRELADIGKDAALSSFLPTVSAGFSFAYGGMGNDSLTGDSDYTAMRLTLGATILLFTGGYRLSRVRAARIEQEKSSLTLTKKQSDIESELIGIRLRLNGASKRIEAARLIETAARRALDLSQTAFTNGLVTRLSVTEAANRLDEASLGFQNAVCEYRLAFYDWEIASGNAE